MGQPHFEVPSGTIDGVNTVFTVSLAYVPGSTAVWLNGVLLEPSLDDGWVESDPASGEITFKEAPQSTGPCPDVLQVFFLDTLPDPIETIVEGIVGTVEAEADVTGSLLEAPIVGELATEASLSGLLAEDAIPVTGTLEPVEALTGLLEVCDS